MSVYDFYVTKQDGAEESLADHRGKVLLIVNTATGCGFTPQYTGLQALYTEYAEKGLEILDFPCNQFADQAPGSDEEIHTFCTGRFGITFPQFAKIDVNGENATPLYQYLVQQKGFAGFDQANALTPVLTDILSKTNPNFENEADIKWNFTKFLVNRSGEVVGRFESTTDPTELRNAIAELL